MEVHCQIRWQCARLCSSLEIILWPFSIRVLCAALLNRLYCCIVLYWFLICPDLWVRPPEFETRTRPLAHYENQPLPHSPDFDARNPCRRGSLPSSRWLPGASHSPWPTALGSSRESASWTGLRRRSPRTRHGTAHSAAPPCPMSSCALPAAFAARQ